jgi:hypothetical protein
MHEKSAPFCLSQGLSAAGEALASGRCSGSRPLINGAASSAGASGSSDSPHLTLTLPSGWDD